MYAATNAQQIGSIQHIMRPSPATPVESSALILLSVKSKEAKRVFYLSFTAMFSDLSRVI